jgi:hypothetical protein
MISNGNHPDIIATKKIIYEKCAFNLNSRCILFRVAKITPTKIGQFVTLYKRQHDNSPIQPFDESDGIDLVVVCARDRHHFGHFVFPKSVLLQQGIFSKNGLGGKRAIRVYPPWDKAINQQAKKTQAWQLKCFLNVSEDGQIDLNQAKVLYSAN